MKHTLEYLVVAILALSIVSTITAITVSYGVAGLFAYFTIEIVGSILLVKVINYVKSIVK